MQLKPSAEGGPLSTDAVHAIAEQTAKLFASTTVRNENCCGMLSHTLRMSHALEPAESRLSAPAWTLLGRDPSLELIRNELKHLRSNSSSGLFHGYGWELIIGDEIYEKN